MLIFLLFRYLKREYVENTIVLFYENYKDYKKITDKVIFDNYTNSKYEKSFFYFSFILVFMGLMINILYFNTLLFYGNILIFLFIILLYLFKIEKILHINISKTIPEYSTIISKNYSKFDRKYLRFLHFYYTRNNNLSFTNISNMIEIADAKLGNRKYTFVDSIIFTIIVSLFIGQLANTFGAFTTVEAIECFMYCTVALIYIRYVILGTYYSEEYKLTEFKEFLVDIKYLKEN